MKHIKIIYLLLLSVALVNCSDDEAPQTALADFQFKIVDTQVTFNGTVENTTAISWDFGDGHTSTEEDPVNVYDSPGTYTVTMTATDGNSTFTETKEVIILPSFDILLTGGQGKPDGKKWRLTRAYTAGKEGAGYLKNDLSLFISSFDNLLAAVGLGASYEDTFTFVHDGSYIVDNVDGQSLMSLLYAFITSPGNITGQSGDPQSVPLANVIYTPKTDATWALNEEDFVVKTINPEVGLADVTFTGKKQLVLDEYFGFKGFSNIVIIKELTETSMNVAIAIHTEQDYYELPTVFFHLSFEAVP